MLTVTHVRLSALAPRVPTRFVQKYTVTAQLEPSGTTEPIVAASPHVDLVAVGLRGKLASRINRGGRPSGVGETGSVRNKRTFWPNSSTAWNMTTGRRPRSPEKRRRLDELMSVLQCGDRLVVSELLRLGRSLGQIVAVLDAPAKAGSAFAALKGEHPGRGQEQHPDEGRDHALRAVRRGRARPGFSERTPRGPCPRARSSGRKLGHPKRPPWASSRLDSKEDRNPALPLSWVKPSRGVDGGAVRGRVARAGAVAVVGLRVLRPAATGAG